MKHESDMNLIMENWRGFLTEEQKRNKVNLLLERLDSSKGQNLLTEEEILFILEEGSDSQVIQLFSKARGAVTKSIRALVGVFSKPSALSNKLLKMADHFQRAKDSNKGKLETAPIRNALSDLLEEFEKNTKLKEVPLKKLRVFNKISSALIRIYSSVRGFALPEGDIEKIKKAGLEAIEKAKTKMAINENEQTDEGSAIEEAKEAFYKGLGKLVKLVSFGEQVNKNYNAIQSAKTKMEEILNKHLNEEEEMTIYKFIESVSRALIDRDFTGHYKKYGEAKKDLVQFIDAYKNADIIFKNFANMSGDVGTGLTTLNFFKNVAVGSLTEPRTFLKLAGVATLGPAAAKFLAIALAAKGTVKVFNEISKWAEQNVNKEEYEASLKSLQSLTPQEAG